MRLDERKENILDFIIRDYVETASPVSSGRVASKKILDSSPATLRNIMLELDEDGYLFQPHTSAGRAPTEKGYRYFIDNLIKFSGKANENSKRSERFSQGVRASEPPKRGLSASNAESVSPEFSELLETLVCDFSHDLGIFTSAMIMGQRGRQELSGFHDVLSEPEFREDGMLENFGRMVDEIDEVMSEYRDALIEDDDDYDIWIGRENIYPGARKGSSLVARINLPASAGRPEKEEMVFFAYGPTRMNYEKAIFKIKSLINEI